MKIYQVDSFTDQPFKGNPAGVCVLDAERTDAWMQSLAAEMNLSETAFVRPTTDGFSLRWFTPTKEVSLCGHATLATAHILWARQILQPEQQARFHTLSGLLTASKDGSWIEMDFPAKEVSVVENNPQLNAALGITPICTSQITHDRGTLYLLEVEAEESVRQLAPDFGQLAAIGARAVIVTSRSRTPGYDFVSRFFAPLIGINEDPVTGSAHCYLAPYWETRLGRRPLVGFQVSARTGIVRCHWQGDRVLLRGQAVTVFEGELLV